MSESLVFHCPHCNEPIGSVRPYTGRPGGRPVGASDKSPRTRRARNGNLNNAIANALQDMAIEAQ